MPWGGKQANGGPKRIGSLEESGPHICPECKRRGACTDSKVVDHYRRRRYRCAGCARRWTTYEMSKEYVTINVEEEIDTSA